MVFNIYIYNTYKYDFITRKKIISIVKTYMKTSFNALRRVYTIYLLNKAHVNFIRRL